MSVRDEILEQPTVAARPLASGRLTAETIAAAVRDRPVELVVIAARGSSDHAAIDAQYVLGTRNRLPVALVARASPSSRSLPPGRHSPTPSRRSAGCATTLAPRCSSCPIERTRAHWAAGR